MHYLCREKYRLDLHWDSVRYHSDSVLVLEGARFSGPVLTNAVKLEAPDFIDLDITPQLLTILDSYYIVRLNWTGVEYRDDGSILLKDATLTNDFLKTLHKFDNSDHVVINTEKHEESTHAFHLVYEAQVIKANKEPHTYRK